MGGASVCGEKGEGEEGKVNAMRFPIVIFREVKRESGPGS